MKMVNNSDISVSSTIDRGAREMNKIGMSTLYEVECYGADGVLKWEDTFKNTVVNAGLDDVLNEYFKGSAYTAAFYIGLIATSTPTVSAADVMSSHAGWTENENYKDTNNGASDVSRPVLTLGTVSSQSVDNTASKGVFAIDTDTQTVGGCFLTDNITKGQATGLLYGGGPFTNGDKSVDDGDTLNVTVTLTAASA